MKILIADDNPMNLKLLRITLQAEGHQVREAADGCEALALLGRETFDVVISDVLMPNLDGYRLCLKIRRDPKLAVLPLILYSSTFESPTDRELAFQCGANLFVGKPAPAAVLLHAIQAAVEAGARPAAPSAEVPEHELDAMKTYSERLVSVIEEKNLELTRRAQALAASEERFRELVAHLPQVLWMATADQRESLYVSPAYERIWGRSCASLAAAPQSWMDAIHPEDRARVAAEATPEKLARGGWWNEYRIVRPDGETRWISDRGFPIRRSDGVVYRVAGVATDITERVVAERRQAAQHAVTLALAESAGLEQAAPRVLQAICGGLGWAVGEIWVPDREARFLGLHTQWHAPAVRVEGFAEASRALTFAPGSGLPGRVWAERAPLWIADVACAADLPRAECAAAAGLHAAFGCPVLAGNQVVAVLTFFSPEIRTPDDDLLQMMGTLGSQLAQFIERRRVEQALLASEAQLRQAQKMESLGLLAGGVAHDFNNLLNAIIGFSDLLALKLRPEDPLRSYADEIQRAGESAAALTRQLLAVSRKQVLRPEVLDLGGLVEEMAKLLRRLIGEDIALETSRAGAAPVRVDRGQMEQVLLNLVVNARDAMPKGGRLTIETRDVLIEGEPARPRLGIVAGRYVVLAVTDTGAGMDAATQARIFEPFFTTKPESKGTGLGLAIVYGVVKQSGGDIWVYSEPGKGTTFKVYLPREAEPAGEKAGAPAGADLPGGAETILLVDDSVYPRSLARVVLRNAGYVVLEAETPEQALRIAAGHAGTIHLLLTDVIMPGMNGIQLAGLLTAERAGLRVLYTSGYTDETIGRQGGIAPEMDFLQKPFTPAPLLRRVRAVLDR
ncbi:MAG: response regulator [Planctomycetes bacterium]|nr:response regulator [Planctomycetota bacterium]